MQALLVAHPGTCPPSVPWRCCFGPAPSHCTQEQPAGSRLTAGGPTWMRATSTPPVPRSSEGISCRKMGRYSGGSGAVGQWQVGGVGILCLAAGADEARAPTCFPHSLLAAQAPSPPTQAVQATLCRRRCPSPTCAPRCHRGSHVGADEKGGVVEMVAATAVSRNPAFTGSLFGQRQLRTPRLTRSPARQGTIHPNLPGTHLPTLPAPQPTCGAAPRRGQAPA